jgi:hypothetical protein
MGKWIQYIVGDELLGLVRRNRIHEHAGGLWSCRLIYSKVHCHPFMSIHSLGYGNRHTKSELLSTLYTSFRSTIGENFRLLLIISCTRYPFKTH